MNEQKADLLNKLYSSVINLDPDMAEKVATEFVKNGLNPLDGIEEGITKGLEEMGGKFNKGECFLPELIMAAEAAQKGIKVFEAKIKQQGEKRETKGRVIIGTVAGDIHSIGKNIVATMLGVNGFEVMDLGADVPTETFVNKVKEFKPKILGLSSLLTTTMPVQKEVIEALIGNDVRENLKILVGGAPVTEEWAKEIGADAYGADASDAVIKTNELLK